MFERVLTILLLVSAALLAQSDASISGVITDESKAIVANATVTATEVSSGRSYAGSTDARGAYRITLEPGMYRIEASASGFATGVISRVELLVGRAVDLPFTLKIASVQQSVDVTAETPLLNVQTQDVGGNIDRRQMQQLPILGRNWMELSLLVKGVTANDVGGNRPGVARDNEFQLNLDGQQISQGLAGAAAFGQPRLSREAIAEYQLITNQFDITLGRSPAVQVNAITRSGTNDLHGSFYGNFRSDQWSAADFVARRVLPYENRQLGGSMGGAIKKDRLHYFAAYEDEREPNTLVTSPQIYSGQVFTIPTNNNQYSIVGRGDYTVSAKDHILVRASWWNYQNPTTGLGPTSYPTAVYSTRRYSPNVVGTWSRVLSPNLLQDVRVGYYKYFWEIQLAEGIPSTPYYNFGSIVIGPNFFYPEDFNERMPSVTYSLSWRKAGHEVKGGGEALFRSDRGFWPSNSRGSVSFRSTPPDLAARFPLSAWNDPSKWNLNGLDSLVSVVTQAYSKDFHVNTPRKEYALWLGDTWKPYSRLSINFGLRWDVDWGQYASEGGRDTSVLINNGSDTPGKDVGLHANVRSMYDIAPRGGVNYRLGKNWVLRAGGGVFYGFQESNMHWGLRNDGLLQLSATYFNDNRPGFLTDWTRGVKADDYYSGKVPIPTQSVSTIERNYRDPRSVQGTAGFQKQIGANISLDADFIYQKSNFLGVSRDINQFRDTVTGYPVNPNPNSVNPNGTVRPLPQFNAITWYSSNLWAEYEALAFSAAKRFARRWQTGGTYTLMLRSVDEGTNSLGYIATSDNAFCLQCELSRSATFQRHTFRFNYIYQLPWGFNWSGIFYAGSGNYFNTSFFVATAQPITIAGGLFQQNRLVVGAPATIPANLAARFDGPTVTPAGGMLPRNAFKGLPLYKFDMRLSKDFKVKERLMMTGLLELFNVFNHPNYGGYSTTVNLPGFGNPTQSSIISYLPRQLQIAFRVGF